jgi:branched-chain amino acid transport system permease protein
MATKSLTRNGLTRDIYGWVATFGVLIVIALVMPDRLSFVITATIFGMFAMSWAFFTSFSGYLNLGHVIFIGLAGYTSGALNYHLGWNMWLCMLCGVAVGTGLGWLYLYPIHRRISGLSFEMVSFLSIIALTNLIVSSYARPLTGGDIGLAPLDGIFESLGLAVALAAVLCVFGLFYARYLKSDSGKIVDFARENQKIVRSAGADPHRYTGRFLLLSGLLGSVGGVLYVHFTGAAVTSNTFALGLMIRIVVMAIIGGRFSLRGSILGAYVVVFLSMVLMPYVDAYVQFLIIYGIGFTLYFVRPAGLISLFALLKGHVPWISGTSKAKGEAVSEQTQS